MVHVYLWIGVGLLLLSNAISVGFIAKHYRSRLDAEKVIHDQSDDIRELEKRVFELDRENIKMHDLNKDLSEKNRLLGVRLGKINAQVKQISDHFKTN